MEHSFDVDVAIKYGVNAAILLHNIYWWIQKNKANNRHFHDGNYWTYNSREAYTKLFPYLSERQVKTAMGKLIADGIVVTGDYNTDRYKRPTWYAITEKGYTMLQKRVPVGTEMSERGDKSASTYTDISTDISTDNKKNNKSISRKRSDSKTYEQGFNEFYSVYPRHTEKSQALSTWTKLKPNDDLKQIIIEDVKRKIDGEWKDRDEKYIPYPSTYLNRRPWEDEPTEPNTQAESDDGKGPFGSFY